MWSFENWRAKRQRRKLTVLQYSITVVSAIRLRSLIGFAQAYPQNPTSKRSLTHHHVTRARTFIG